MIMHSLSGKLSVFQQKEGKKKEKTYVIKFKNI